MMGLRKPLVTSDVRRDESQVLIRLYPKKEFGKLQPTERADALMAMATVLQLLADQMLEEAAIAVDGVLTVTV